MGPKPVLCLWYCSYKSDGTFVFLQCSAQNFVQALVGACAQQIMIPRAALKQNWMGTGEYCSSFYLL